MELQRVRHDWATEQQQASLESPPQSPAPWGVGPQLLLPWNPHKREGALSCLNLSVSNLEMGWLWTWPFLDYYCIWLLNGDWIYNTFIWSVKWVVPDNKSVVADHWWVKFIEIQKKVCICLGEILYIKSLSQISPWKYLHLPKANILWGRNSGELWEEM